MLTELINTREWASTVSFSVKREREFLGNSRQILFGFRSTRVDDRLFRRLSPFWPQSL